MNKRIMQKRLNEEFWRLYAQANNLSLGTVFRSRLEDKNYYSIRTLEKLCEILRCVISDFNNCSNKCFEFNKSHPVGIFVYGDGYYDYKNGKLVRWDNQNADEYFKFNPDVRVSKWCFELK